MRCGINLMGAFMSRLSLLLVAFAVLSAPACGSKKSLAEACDQDSDCETGLCAKITSDASGKQCTQACGSSDECTSHFGSTSYCIGAGVCVRECAKDSDCPGMTSCYSNAFCKR